MQDNNREANEMKRAKENFARPYGLRDFEFVRAGPDGAYWQHSDGMVVRMAAPEVDRAQMRVRIPGGPVGVGGRCERPTNAGR